MTDSSPINWLDWTKRLQAIAQIGLHFAKDPYDIERYKAVRQIAAEMTAENSGTPCEVVLEAFTNQRGYATPKIDVRGVVFRDDKLLFVRERMDGQWSLPGGWGDVCQSPAENAVREVFEESGFVVEAKKLLAVFDREKHPHVPPYPFHIYKLFMLCEIVGGRETLSEETDAVGFFGETELPELSLLRITPDQIRRMFEHHRNPNLPTDFDY
jgi:ADP-ribose pyrophosphatase YjhB (NUDIX family)